MTLSCITVKKLFQCSQNKSIFAASFDVEQEFVLVDNMNLCWLQ